MHNVSRCESVISVVILKYSQRSGKKRNKENLCLKLQKFLSFTSHILLMPMTKLSFIRRSTTYVWPST